MRKEVGRKWYQSIDLISSYSCVVLTLAGEIKLKMVEKNTEEQNIEVKERIMRHANTVKKG